MRMRDICVLRYGSHFLMHFSSMTQSREQLLAKQMLESRGRGYSFGTFLRQQRKRHFLALAAFASGLVIVALLKNWPIFFFALGMLVGGFLRDIEWVSAVALMKPFTEKVTDWEKVRQLAEQPDASA